ncbi:MAG TPA: aminotransferase class V-fold PLP-dependent enzyme [Chloroflexota bacterium]|nr:aminotransferase class V-fold PLP-dependent enzyme [Chloroflexota bacterium]
MNADLSHPDIPEPTDGNRSPHPLDFSPETRGRWEWPAEEIRRVGYQVVDLIADHLAKLPEQPVFQPVPAELAEEFLTTPRPVAGQAPDAILAEFAATIAPYPFGNGHPRFFGWVNSPPAVLSIFAEALAAAMNPSVAGGNHAAVYVERQVGHWFAELLGFPTTSMGLLVSGGSMATLTGLAVARHVKAGWDVRAGGLQGAIPRLIVYASVEGHGCARKAVEMLGIGGENLRLVAADEGGRMRVAELEEAVGRDRTAGHRPIAVVASAGTVNTGAIDPLAEIADLCRRHELWLHVDGAYGAPAILTTRYREELAPLSLADSVALDPHKWLYVPVEAGLVLVRDAEALRDTFSLVPPYLRTDGNPTGVGGPPWLSEFGFQQTRGFRALKVWMALKHHGTSGYAEAIEHDCALARYLAEQVAERPDLELLAANLSIVCFRYRPRGRGHEAERINTLNQMILHDLQLGGRAFLSSTMLDGRFVLRACIVNPRTTIADIEILVDTVETIGARLMERGEIA